MASPTVYTYEDALAVLTGFAGSRGVGKEQGTLRYCVESALREIVSVRDWKCLKKIWRVPLQATIDGTATYAATGGASDYLVTLATGTTASWMVDGVIRLNDIPCDIDSVPSSSTLVLRPPRVPTEDITTAVSCTIGRSWYELPPEFISSWAPAERNMWYIGEYIPFEEWHRLEKYDAWSGTVTQWTIGPAPNRYGTLALYVTPWTASTSECDLVMKTRPRSMAISGQESWNSAGTVTVTADSRTVTGSGTSFRSTMAGAIIRFSNSSTKPTGSNGANPYVFQQSIASVDTTAQTMLLGAASSVSLAGVKYTVSDPIDLQVNVYDAFLRNCEKQLAHAAGMEDYEAIERHYHVALTQAKITDATSREPESGHGRSRTSYRLSDNTNRRVVDYT